MDNPSNFDIMALTLFLPLAGALAVGSWGKSWGRATSAVVASGSILLSFLVVVTRILQYNATATGDNPNISTNLWTWANMVVPDGTEEKILNVGFGIYVDALSLTLMTVITGVGFLIHWYSTEYMKEDPEFTRYFCLLNLFVAAMTLLVLANNFATLIIGWGGVGFASYSLIGFFREKPSAGAAAKKAFVLNVVGDIGLMVAVFILVYQFGALDYETIFQTQADRLAGFRGEPWVNWVLIGLLVGAYAKSAQLPLHTWLPDAMEGPTPVSALIHAATMVTAGVYLLVRCHPILELSDEIRSVVAVLGALTALFAACCAIVQNDLKRVLAYSTMSQLGYMFLAVGVGAYGAAIFHLVTHAFFKALLFLAAGIVIHTAHGEQDMRRLGGLVKDIPYTAFMFAIGGAALAGVPFTAGGFSKEAILHAAAHEKGQGTFLYIVGAGVAILTAFYTFRAFFMTFYGPQRVDQPHLPGGPTIISCTVLTVLSLLGGFLHGTLTDFLGNVDWARRSQELLQEGQGLVRFKIEPGVTEPSAIGLGVLVVIAIAGAYAMYGRGQQDKLGRNTTVLSFARRGFGIDDGLLGLASGFQLFARLLSQGVDRLFTRVLPGLVSQSFLSMGSLLKGTQTGQIRHYMVSIMVSIMVLLVYSLFIGGGFLQ